MWEPDTHQAILQEFAEPEVIAMGSEKERREEKGREGEHPFGTKDVRFQMPSEKKRAFQNVKRAC